MEFPLMTSTHANQLLPFSLVLPIGACGLCFKDAGWEAPDFSSQPLQVLYSCRAVRALLCTWRRTRKCEEFGEAVKHHFGREFHMTQEALNWRFEVTISKGATYDGKK